MLIHSLDNMSHLSPRKLREKLDFRETHAIGSVAIIFTKSLDMQVQSGKGIFII